jgi:hypothetical protein
MIKHLLEIIQTYIDHNWYVYRRRSHTLLEIIQTYIDHNWYVYRRRSHTLGSS